MKTIRQATILFLLMTGLTGIAYPIGITFIAQTFFKFQAGGNLFEKDGKVAGSYLIAQKFESPKYFWPRPSSGDFNANPSGASNLGPTSNDLKKQIQERRAKISAASEGLASALIPQELITTSGSGLDPHLTPEGARFQAARVAKARNMGSEGEKVLLALIDSLQEKRDFDVFGEPRVNVLKLNLALDKLNQGRK